MSWNQSSYVSTDVRDVRVTAFLSKVYGWMFLGLLITAGTAMLVASSETLIETFIGNRILFWILVLGQLGLVFYLSARVEQYCAGNRRRAFPALLGDGRRHLLSHILWFTREHRLSPRS